eukprot:gene4948-3549_t
MNFQKLRVNLEAIQAAEARDVRHDMVRIGSLQVSSRGLTSPTGTSYELTLDDFVLVPGGELGKGSSGAVYKAVDRRTGRTVALKEIKVTSSTSQKEIRRELETLYASDASHPGMVDFYGAFYHEGSVFIAMECLDGSLDRLPQPMPTDILARVARSVLQGLTYLHRQRHLIHRDIKPSNVLYSCRSGEIKISDFGISSSLDGTCDNAQTFVGTVTYMSPERLKGEQYAFAADVWSFGLVVAEMALGTSPYRHLFKRGDTTEARFWALLQHLSEDGPAVPLPSSMDPLLTDFIESCLQKDPEARRTCAALLNHAFLQAVQPEADDTEQIRLWLQANAPQSAASSSAVAPHEPAPSERISEGRSNAGVEEVPAAGAASGARAGDETGTSSVASTTLSLDEELQRLLRRLLPTPSFFLQVPVPRCCGGGDAAFVVGLLLISIASSPPLCLVLLSQVYLFSSFYLVANGNDSTQLVPIHPDNWHFIAESLNALMFTRLSGIIVAGPDHLYDTWNELPIQVVSAAFHDNLLQSTCLPLAPSSSEAGSGDGDSSSDLEGWKRTCQAVSAKGSEVDGDILQFNKGLSRRQTLGGDCKLEAASSTKPLLVDIRVRELLPKLKENFKDISDYIAFFYPVPSINEKLTSKKKLQRLDAVIHSLLIGAMKFDDEEFKRKRLAARAAYLKKRTAQQQAAAAAAVEERINEMEQGLIPKSITEAVVLAQRTQEVSVAKGLVTAAAAPLLPEALQQGQEGASTIRQHVKKEEGYILDEKVIAERVAAHDYTPPPSEEELQRQALARLQEQQENLQKQRRSLPIYRVRDEMLALIRDNPVIVVVGETGSGKTTQLLQYMYEEEMHVTTLPEKTEAGESAAQQRQELRLICTQPRRIAAVSVAERVAQEVGCRCGGVVGYKVRFDDRSGPHTKILFVTDGIMLKEFTNDPSLESVAAIMIDEAHERSLNSDILLGLLRDVVRRNSRLRVIIASATINADRFRQFFGGAPVFTVTGRTYPVETFYTEEPVADYVTEAAQTAMGIHLERPLPGDILIFLPGQDAIEACVETIRQLAEDGGESIRPPLLLPIFSSLPPKEQALIYEPTPPDIRKIVVATNIAETSITIDGVVYVIDCGLCKQNYYNPRTATEELRVVPISQASAMQRAGRAGRTQPGECYRLYTSYTFRNELPPDTVPEVMRCAMSTVVLQLKVLGIDNLLQFDFLDPPSTASLEVALDQLFLLGAMKADGKLTVTGRRMAEFPLEPSWSKALIRSCKLGCARHMAMAASMLTLESIFVNSREARERQKADGAKDVFFAAGNGDVAGLVHLMESWLRCSSPAKAMEFCRKYSVQHRSMLRARDVLDQILATMDRVGLELGPGSAPYDATEDIDGLGPAPPPSLLHVEHLTKALLSGFFYNVARLESDRRTYTVVRPLESSLPDAYGDERAEGNGVEIHPTSFLFRAGMSKEKISGGPPMVEKAAGPAVLRERPSLVVFTALRHTKKRYMAAPQNYFEREMLEDAPRKRQRV